MDTARKLPIVTIDIIYNYKIGLLYKHIYQLAHNFYTDICFSVIIIKYYKRAAACGSQVKLNLDVIMLQHPETLTILQMEKDLRNHVDSLSSVKQKRLAQLRQRLQVDEQLCANLGTTAFHLPSGCVVPTEQQLYDLDEHILELEAEKVR